jgi:hypothetical protein
MKHSISFWLYLAIPFIDSKKLDLYHFPLRGQEQAEFMAERVHELKRIYKEYRGTIWPLPFGNQIFGRTL